MIAQATLPKLEPCPVCFNDDLSSLKRLNGCGHSVCGDCKFEMYDEQNQFVLQKIKIQIDFVMKLLKCPICRSNEKPTCDLARENSETQIGKHVRLIEEFNPFLSPRFDPHLISRAINPNRRRVPMRHCQNSDCTRKCRTRDRCPNHHAVPCCARHSGCDQCINP